MIGFEPLILIPEIKEDRLPGEDIPDFLERICLAKAFAVYSKSHFNHLLVAADTVVLCRDRLLGKPADREEARTMLECLSGCRHEVFTGLALLYKGRTSFTTCRTGVCFKKLLPREIEFYLDRNEHLDKAGAYAIQGTAAVFVESIEGCYFNVMGLPLNLFYTQLSNMGLPLCSIETEDD